MGLFSKTIKQLAYLKYKKNLSNLSVNFYPASKQCFEIRKEIFGAFDKLLLICN